MIGVADDRDIAMRDLAVLDRFDGGRGQVDHDIALAELEIRAGQPVGGGGELLEPDLRRHVHILQRRASDDSGLLEPHARLEALDGRGQLGSQALAGRVGPRRDRPRSPDACAVSRPAGPCRPDAARRCRSASRRRRRSRHSARRPWRWRRRCSAEASGSGRSTARSRAAGGGGAIFLGFGGAAAAVGGGEPGAAPGAGWAVAGAEVGAPGAGVAEDWPGMKGSGGALAAGVEAPAGVWEAGAGCAALTGAVSWARFRRARRGPRAGKGRSRGRGRGARKGRTRRRRRSSV